MNLNINTDIILYEEPDGLSEGYVFVTQQFFNKNYVLQIDLLQDWIGELETIKDMLMAAAYRKEEQ
jgi:hypothetical protein